MFFDSTRREFLLDKIPAATLASMMTGFSRAQASGPDRKKLKIGQIGVGHSHAKGKMSALRSSPDWEVVGVVEPNRELRDEAEHEDIYSGLKWMTSEELLNQPELDAVAVETTVDPLLDVAQTCISAGKHIHLDKPPGNNLAQFQQLLATADDKQLVVQLGYMYRYNPGVVLLHDLLEKGWLGEVFEVHAVMSKEVGAKKRKRWSQYPGGTMFELGCHLIDLVVGILGPPEKVTPYNRRSGKFEDDLMDNMLALCEYPDATATIKSTALEVEGFERRHLVVCGTEGTLHIKPLDETEVLLAL